MAADALQVLLDKQVITEALYRYCRSMDRMDNELGFDVFHDDAVADYGPIYQGTGHGFVAFANRLHVDAFSHQHQLGNPLVRVEGDRAFSESYVTVNFRLPGSDGGVIHLVSHGRYVDRWERRSGKWAIAHRIYIHVMEERRPIEGHVADLGRRDRSDASYGEAL